MRSHGVGMSVNPYRSAWRVRNFIGGDVVPDVARMPPGLGQMPCFKKSRFARRWQAEQKKEATRVASIQVLRMGRDQSLTLSRAKYVRPNQSYCEAPMTVLPVKFSGALPPTCGGVRLVRLRIPNMTPMLP